MSGVELRGPGPAVPADTVSVRTARERDLDALAAFEVTIAEVSFGDDAVTDHDVHRKKLAKALDRDRESMFVAEGPDGAVTGWLWLAINTNFLTGQRYANFRSLAIADDAADGTADALLEHALGCARALGVTEVVGRVHVDNLSMRVLYQKFGFHPTFLTMRWSSGTAVPE